MMIDSFSLEVLVRQTDYQEVIALKVAEKCFKSTVAGWLAEQLCC